MKLFGRRRRPPGRHALSLSGASVTVLAGLDGPAAGAIPARSLAGPDVPDVLPAAAAPPPGDVAGPMESSSQARETPPLIEGPPGVPEPKRPRVGLFFEDGSQVVLEDGDPRASAFASIADRLNP